MRVARFTNCVVLGTLACIAASSAASGQVREYVENGVAYRETTEVVRKPVSTTTWQEKRETVLVDRVTTQLQETDRNVLVPTVTYQWQPKVHGAWNPFTPKHVAYHMVPVTSWEVQQQTVRTPVTYREMIPEERIVRTPQRSMDFVEETVTRRVAINDSTGEPLTLSQTGGTTIARRPESYGGVMRMKSDLPREGVQR
jgi:hypothetical protein